MAVTLTRRRFHSAMSDLAFKVYLDGEIVAKIYEEETITIPLTKSQAILTVKPLFERKVSFKVTDGDDLVLVATRFNKIIYRYFNFYWIFLILSNFVPILDVSSNFFSIILLVLLLSCFLVPIFEFQKIEASQENNPIKIE
ncbi:hypothetical protein [Streptococcus pacificus]|uniref:Uncharacterized protein n=1 Tax=Streptococcus pacificus TaxID=2740577 RepID=A0ABS0ZHX3_9STRE|nr:hypothetical protein [Streptococcus pacificus]MBJ8325308.1 hypothetical protein [Streptococcus pacificus]